LYRCSRCGKILYVFWEVGQDCFGVPTPSEVASMYDGVCPYCGKPLGEKCEVKVYSKEEALKNKRLVKELQRISKQLRLAVGQPYRP